MKVEITSEQMTLLVEQVVEQVKEAGGRTHYVDPGNLPLHQGIPVPANVFVLGAALGHTRLGEILNPPDMAHVVQTRWTKGTERNTLAFQAGLKVPTQEL